MSSHCITVSGLTDISLNHSMYGNKKGLAFLTRVCKTTPALMMGGGGLTRLSVYLFVFAVKNNSKKSSLARPPRVVASTSTCSK